MDKISAIDRAYREGDSPISTHPGCGYRRWGDHDLLVVTVLLVRTCSVITRCTEELCHTDVWNISGICASSRQEWQTQVVVFYIGIISSKVCRLHIERYCSRSV